jgi:cell division protein FtsN
LRDELIDDGYQAYVLNLPVDAFYRVRIGKFGSKLDAEFLEQKLKAKGFSTRICP